MNRVRPVETLLAALATLAVALPLTTLFTPTAAWFRPSVALVALVALAGMALRRVTSSRPLVVGGQAVLLLVGSAQIHGQGHLWRGVVPGLETGQAFGILLGQAYETVTRSTAPAPSNRGTILAVSVLIGLTGLAVDAIAVTYRSPALAGVPLLGAFLGSATNSGDGLGAWYAVPGIVCWLALVGRQGVVSLRSWGSVTPRSSSGRFSDPTTAFATMGRVVGVAALAVAVVLPGLVPHFPTTFIADGLGRSDNGRGGTGSNVRLASSVDIARDLGNRSTDPVLRYRTTSDQLQPLRVTILDSYRRGLWQSRSNFTFVPVDGRIPAPVADAEVPRRVERITVSENRVGIPQVALPAGTTGTPFPAGSWDLTVQGVVQLTQPIDSYTADVVEIDPTQEQFATNLDGPPDDQGNLALDPRSENEVRALLDRLTDDGDSALEVARSIQAYLRGFTYSVDLVDDGADGRLPADALVRFLETRRGYCIQFATAMVMLSRAAGIPARFAVGYLPGAPDGDDRVVRINDAHAWPELWFPRLGWVRFEPTPGSRSGVAPAYSLVPTDTGSSSGPSASSSNPSSSAGPSTAPTRNLADEALTPGGGSSDRGVVGFASDHALTIGIVLLALVAGSVVPLGAWLSRRRARRLARDDAERVEAEWQSLLLRLQDIGYAAPEGATPRQASRQLSRAAYLTQDESDALGRVVATLERARYARPGLELADVTDDASTVWTGALSRRRRGDRIRALLLPEEGRRHWRDTATRAVPWRRKDDTSTPDD